MTAATLPGTCRTVLKEWATVLEAMGRGEQVVLIRKGGVIEPGSGFELRAETFIFSPTFEHQAVAFLREPFRAYFEAAAARRAPAGQLRFELAGRVAWSTRTTDAGCVPRLAAAHIYNEAFVAQRLKWQPDQPLAVVAVRVYRLAAPVQVPAAPSYAGCTSWVELEAEVPLIGATPVMDDARFAQKLHEVKTVFGQS